MFLAAVRLRRQASNPNDLGNTLDGVLQKMLPHINNTLKTADLNMEMAFKNIFNMFSNSVKALLNGKVQIGMFF